MRKLLHIAIVLSVALSSVSCVIDDATSTSTESLAHALWHASKTHINIVSDAVEEAIHIAELVKIEDEATFNNYLALYFLGATVTEHDYGYSITKLTNYNTKVAWTVTTNNSAFGEGEWIVKRSGGNYYELTIRPCTCGKLVAEMKYYNEAQTGEAFLEFNYELIDEATTPFPGVEAWYAGIIEVVDPKESAKSPLHLTIDIKQDLHISEYYGLIGGEVDIECIDEIYGSKDNITAEIFFDPRRVDIECYGEYWTLYE